MLILYPVSGLNDENILFMILPCKKSDFDGENNIGGDIW